VKTLALGLVLIAACAGAQKRGSADGEEEPFRCLGRHAAYVVTGSIAASEAGIKISCEGEVPTVEEYRIGGDGREARRAARISREGWEEAWHAFDSAGWENLGDCKNPGAGKKDPFFVFEIADEERQLSLSCKGTTLPHPFDTFRDALDRAKGELPIEER
jgi:hypothetical protein